MSKHRALRDAQRRGRVGALVLALGVTVIAGAAGVGLLPRVHSDSASADTGSASARPATIQTAALAEVAVPRATRTTTPPKPSKPSTSATRDAASAPLPPGSGEGRRIVFDQGAQRVWLVGGDGDVERTYPVSGSRFDNLHPGTFSVLSRSRYATSYDYSGKLEYFVHFTTGYSAPIGFHAVPRDNAGKLEQTRAQLGTPLSAGCVRQWRPDAIALWDFAPVGTKVVVTA